MQEHSSSAELQNHASGLRTRTVVQAVRTVVGDVSESRVTVDGQATSPLLDLADNVRTVWWTSSGRRGTLSAFNSTQF